MVDRRVRKQIHVVRVASFNSLYPAATTRPSNRLFLVGTRHSVPATYKSMTEFSDTLRK